jgi:hypothetical protein
MKTRPKASDGAVGGRLTYSFTPTAIGVTLTVRDTLPGNEAQIDLTDYSSW